MSSGSSQDDLSPQILEEAAAWLIESNDRELDAGQRAAFNHWMRRSPEHVRAYLELSAVSEESLRFDGDRSLDRDALIAEARAESNVVTLVPAAGGRTNDQAAAVELAAERSHARTAYMAIAASVLIVIGAMSIWFILHRNTYSTDLGEQRSIVLADGSTIELNSRSKIRVGFSRRERSVDLLEGQALFDVSKDPNRPFIVRSDATHVRALGTQFDVYRKRSGTIVTVIDGRVAVLPGSRPALGGSSAPAQLPPGERASVQPFVLSAGEQLTIAPALLPRPVRANVAAVTAWTQRKLIFEGTPLADVVEEFNRYGARRLVIDDPALANFHVRGTFSAAHPETLAQFLRQRFGVFVTESAAEIKISTASPTR